MTIAVSPGREEGRCLRRAWLVLPLAAAVLAACPEERPGIAKEIPPQRIPPAMPVEAPVPGAPDGGMVPGAAVPEAGPPPASTTGPAPVAPPGRRR